MSEFQFLIFISCFITQILICYAYFFAAIRRMFISPSSANPLVLLIPLIGIPGYFLVFIWGWIKSGRHQLTRLMTGWTSTLMLMVMQGMLLSSLGKVALEPVVLTGTTVLLIALLIIILVPFLRSDERMRALIRDPNMEGVNRLCALGPQILPLLKYMLSDEYQPTRLSAIDCLSELGEAGIPLLQVSTLDADPVVASAAKNALHVGHISI